MVSGDDDERDPEAAQEASRALVLASASAVREVAARDDQLGADAGDERGDRRLDLGVFAGAGVEVGEVEDPGWHRRVRL